MSIIRKGKRKIARKKVIVICIACLLTGITLVLGGSILLNQVNTKNHKKEQTPITYGVVVLEDLAQGEVLKQEQLMNIPLLETKQQLNTVSLEDAVNSKLKYGVKSNTVLSPEMIDKGELLADDLRKHAYHFIEITEALSRGDYVDIRIQFPNGADYIVLSKKRVLDCSLYDEVAGTDNCLWIEVSEEEILTLSSAVVDAYYNDQAKIYAIQYVTQDQEKAIVTYPVNDIVQALIQDDPNVVDKAIAHMENRVRERVTMQIKEYQDQDVSNDSTTYSNGNSATESIQESEDVNYIDGDYVD